MNAPFTAVWESAATRPGPRRTLKVHRRVTALHVLNLMRKDADDGGMTLLALSDADGQILFHHPLGIDTGPVCTTCGPVCQDVSAHAGLFADQPLACGMARAP